MPDGLHNALGLVTNMSFVMLLLFVAVGLVFSSYIKIATVLAFVRAGFGFTGLPSIFVTGALAFALTLFVMTPTWQKSLQRFDTTMSDKRMTPEAAQALGLMAAADDWKDFLKQHTSAELKNSFVVIAQKIDLRRGDSPGNEAETLLADSWRVLAPAFILSELKKAFTTGVYLFLPFLLVDLLVAIVLAAMNITQLNPYLTALPLKVLLFIALDGWNIIGLNLVNTYGA